MRSLDIKPYILAYIGDVYVLNKPYDWPTSGKTLEDDDCVQYHLIKYHGSMVWILHQLDADTSGVCLFSTNKKNIRKIQELWWEKETCKEYYAIVKGEPDWEQIDEKSSIGMVDERSLGVHPEGKSAHSHFSVMDKNNGASLIRARIYTGRTHQIRIHLAHLGFPLMGEEWYVEPACKLHPRQALHAYSIRFPRNEVLEQTYYRAPVPEDILHLANSYGLRFE